MPNGRELFLLRRVMEDWLLGLVLPPAVDDIEVLEFEPPVYAIPPVGGTDCCGDGCCMFAAV